MEKMKIENVKAGEFVKVSENGKRVYTRGDYCRINKMYELIACDDICAWRYVKKGTYVYVGFDY